MSEGGKKYQIKGCAGKGGFAQVFKACLHGRPDDLVAIKVSISCVTLYICVLRIFVDDCNCFEMISDTKASFSMGVLYVPPA